METTITIGTLLEFAAIIGGLWGLYKIIMEIINAITTRHDREQRWDKYEEKIKDAEGIKTEMIEAYEKDQKEKWKEYDNKIERTNISISKIDAKIDDLSTDTEAKMQEIKSELCILTECMNAVLDGLKQLNCNGPVTEAKDKLETYLTTQAHK